MSRPPRVVPSTLALLGLCALGVSPASAPVAAQIVPPPLATPASVTIQRIDFSGPWARPLTALHRGVNLNVLEDSSVRWDAATPGNTGFADVSASATFRGLISALQVGSLRLPGGTQSNYYDYDLNKAWFDWAINNTSRYNKDPAIDWAGFWAFHSATGALPLMNTANVYKSGKPGLSNWLSASTAGRWVSDYAARGITGSAWETGNEVYSSAQTPGLIYPGTSPVAVLPTYLGRACEVASAVKGADASAQVGLVVYEHQGSPPGFTAIDNASSFCGLGSFDFFILHDYAPLFPQPSDHVTFYQTGVEMALSYQGLVKSVSDLRSYLSASYPSHKDKPIYVTEYGVLAGSNGAALNMADTDWYNKTSALLLLHHYFDLIAQGVDGLWYWEPLGSYFRLINPDTMAQTRLYELLQRAFGQQGKLMAVPVSGGKTYHVTGPISSGCLEGETSGCWYSALGAMSLIDQPSLKVFAALHEGLLVKKLTITALNFASSAHSLTMNLSGFAGVGYHSSWSVAQWQVSGSSWDATLGSATTSSYSVASGGGAGALSSKLIPARSAVTFEITL